MEIKEVTQAIEKGLGGKSNIFANMSGGLSSAVFLVTSLLGVTQQLVTGRLNAKRMKQVYSLANSIKGKLSKLRIRDTKDLERLVNDQNEIISSLANRIGVGAATDALKAKLKSATNQITKLKQNLVNYDEKEKNVEDTKLEEANKNDGTITSSVKANEDETGRQNLKDIDKDLEKQIKYNSKQENSKKAANHYRSNTLLNSNLSTTKTENPAKKLTTQDTIERIRQF